MSDRADPLTVLLSALDAGDAAHVEVTVVRDGQTATYAQTYPAGAVLPTDDGTTHGVFVRVVEPVDANPLDEGDHRDRVGRHGVVIARHSFRHWHTLGGICRCTARSNMALVDWDSHYGPLRFAESDA